MKLSEAIREGAKIRPQCYGAFFGNGTAENPIASCALGSALEGAKLVEVQNLWPTNMGFALLAQQWPEIQNAKAPCPAKCNSWICHDGDSIEGMIQHLNDNCRWTREQIADWLEERGY
jgi:hypothetical protein